MVNIFIGLSQNQINNHSLVISQMGIENENNILLTSNALFYNEKHFNKVHSFEGNFNNNSSNLYDEVKNMIQKIGKYKKLIQKITPYKEEQEIQIFFSYIEDVLTNNLFLSFNKNSKGIVVEDGVLNYYKHTLSNINPLKFVAKYFLANFLGVRFKKYKGHSSGINYNKAIKQFVKIPTKSICPEKSVQMQYPIKSISEFSNSILIIGQEPLETIIGSDLYYKKLSLIFSNAKRLKENENIDTIYYKPHRNGSEINSNFIATYFTEKEIFILKNNKTIENLYFKQLKSKYILAFNSSAILNIYTTLEKNNRKDLNITVYLDKTDSLKSLFKSFDFEIIFFEK